MNRLWPVLRIVVAVGLLAAVGAQFQLTVVSALNATDAWGRHMPTAITNFFSFFTILSNAAAAVVLIVAAVWGWRTRQHAKPEPRWLALSLVCAGSYMIVTGLVYNAMLRGLPLDQGATVPWSNELLHVVGPLFFVIDAVIAPRKRRLQWRDAWIAAVFPLLWVVYTLLRAPFVKSTATGTTPWYPYPFLNPASVPGEHLGVAVYVVVIALSLVALALLQIWLARQSARRAELHGRASDPALSPGRSDAP
ncbi:Pr6Pr family membrane protein [Microbacterium sp. ISL-59]|uniref:Pr6Pr family membrane protein n=1 Tax=Microbacterium sp. ISL-59 TaxID=2819159 RepID=UPI001BEC0551|nr:Pr6Pr family membrane protein [Microbacterium sp. ISL-59]MBT2495825.1 Pr6Pr family membrane protein [Microbacterium sp. ISL-59]